MKTIRFSETVTRRRHGSEQVFEQGQKYTLREDVANHYIGRGQAAVVGSKEAKKPAPIDITEIEKPDGDAVEGSENVGGADGDGAGERSEPAGKPASSGKGSDKRKG